MVSPSANLEYGKAGWVTATLKSPRKGVEPTGSLVFYLDGLAQPEPDRYVDYWSGDVHFTLELPLNAVGAYEIMAEYCGDANFLAAFDVTTSYLVERAQVSTLASHGALGNTDSYIYGEPINLWSVIPGVPVNFAGEQGTQEFFVQRQGTQEPRLSVGTGGLQTEPFPFFEVPISEEAWAASAFLWSTAVVSTIAVGTWEVTADFHGNENLLPWVGSNDAGGPHCSPRSRSLK